MTTLNAEPKDKCFFAPCDGCNFQIKFNSVPGTFDFSDLSFVKIGSIASHERCLLKTKKVELRGDDG